MGAAAAAPLFLLNLDKSLSVVYNDSQAKLATKDDSRLRRYEIGFRPSSFVLRFSSLVLMKMSAQICAYIFTNYHEHFV